MKPLTPRELDVVRLICDGLTYKGVGKKLDLAECTVKNHMRHLRIKLQAKTKAHIIAICFRHGVVK